MNITFTRNWIVGTLLIAIIVGVGIAKIWVNVDSVDAEVDSVVSVDNVSETIVATVGDDTVAGTTSGNSWAGTIISLGTVPVQPAREGNIVSWMVRIGDSVYAGQPIAKLSEPPAMPDLINMLATEAKMLAEKRASAETTKQFVLKNNEQLKTQLAAFEKSSGDSSSLLGSESSTSAVANAKLSIEQANLAVQSMRGEIRSFLDQMVSEHVNVITNTHIASLYRGGGISISYGLLDQDARNVTDVELMRLIVALRDKSALPVDEAKAYLSATVRLAHSTVYSEGVEDIRSMMKTDQSEFLAMVSDYKDAEADVSMKATDYEAMNIEQKRMLVADRRMIEEKIAENEKMVSMAEAEVVAGEAAYATILQGTKGGLYINAPLSGVISTIEKNVGEFVMPSMAVARVTSRGANAAPFVRFRIPGNVRTPKVGTLLKVVRPGFSQNVQEVRVTGVGASLDSGGMYMADASFTKSVAWPIDASVRVLASENSNAVTVKLSSVWWNQNNESLIWMVSQAGRVYSKKVTLGRSLGTIIEVYEGLAIGDKYILKPTADITEDMSVDTLVPKQVIDEDAPAESSEHDAMPGM